MTATNANGNGPASPASAAAIPKTVPSAPAKPGVAATDSQITVTFTAPADGGSPITGYTANCTSSNGGTPGTNTGASSPITVAGLDNGKTYTCTVTATNANGNGPASPASNPAVPNTTPDAPAQPAAAAGNGQLTVTFTAPFNGGSTITGYTANCTSSNGGTPGTNTGPSSPIAVAGLDNGKTYTCTVTATNANGDGPTSPASAAAVPNRVPDAPAQPTVVAGPGQITVTFAAPFDGGSAITGYTATCTSSNSGTPASDTGPTSPIVVSPLDNAKTYTCTVTATNANGTSVASPASGAATPKTVPSPPAKPTTAPANEQITVTFTAPFNGGSTITGYTANCTSSNGGTAGSNTGTTSPIIVTGLTNAKTYTCTVTATNVAGNSAPSPASSPTVPNRVPDPPAQPTVVAGNGQITVTFTAPNDGGSPITGYTASCASANGGTTGGATNDGTTTSIAVSGLTNGKIYTCAVFASNDNGDSAFSPASVSAVPTGTPNAAPRPSVQPGNARLTVTFTAPFNGGKAITGYAVACTSTNGGTARTNSGTGSPIIVTGLTNAKTYTCTVTASNANGAGPASAPSGAVVPSTAPNAPAKPTVVAGSQQITVSFRAPTGVGNAVTSYTASCGSSDGGRPGSRTGPSSPLIVTGLTNANTYTCTVTARNVIGTGAASPPSNPVIPVGVVTPASTPHGFRLFAGDGGVFTFGDARNFGSAAGIAQHLVVGMAPTPTNRGYWMVATDGGIFSFGDAHFYGSTGAIRLNQPVVGMTPTPTGKGYWLVASDGGIFSFGDAHFYGSTGAIHLNQPIVGMAATPTGKGYWMVASDGGIFSFGDAHFYGTPAGFVQAHVVGMSTTNDGHGYWVAASDGTVYSFGNAAALGGLTIKGTRLPVVGIASTPTGRGYWLAAGDGGVFVFGDAPYIGWPGPLVLVQTIRGVSR